MTKIACLTSKEGLVKQVHIENNYQPDDERSDKRCNAMVDQGTHEITAPCEHDQRHEGKGNAKAEENLANDHGAGRIEVKSNHHKSWKHCDKTTQPDGDLAADKALH